MTTYKVETKNGKTGAWDDNISIKPEYIVKAKTVYRYFLFAREIGIIPNLREAEEKALEKAKKFAKSFAKTGPCRISAVRTENGVKASDVVWQNGVFVDKSRHIVWRVWEWLNG